MIYLELMIRLMTKTLEAMPKNLNEIIFKTDLRDDVAGKNTHLKRFCI